MVISILVVLAISYVCFVFFSEQINPLSKPKAFFHRAGWRFGRRMGLSAAACGALAAVLLNVFFVSTLVAVVTGLLLFGTLWVINVYQFKRGHSA